MEPPTPSESSKLCIFTEEEFYIDLYRHESDHWYAFGNDKGLLVSETTRDCPIIYIISRAFYNRFCYEAFDRKQWYKKIEYYNKDNVQPVFCSKEKYDQCPVPRREGWKLIHKEEL